jgi:hypothetical protein
MVATGEETDAGVKSLGLTDLSIDFARHLVSSLALQLRSVTVGFRVDGWIRYVYPGLWPEQEQVLRSQLDENQRALAPETRSKFPKSVVDVNSAMNAAFAHKAASWLSDPRIFLPYAALGYKPVAMQLLDCLDRIAPDPLHDRELVTRWAEILGLTPAFHFAHHDLT